MQRGAKNGLFYCTEGHKELCSISFMGTKCLLRCTEGMEGIYFIAFKGSYDSTPILNTIISANGENPLTKTTLGKNVKRLE